MVVPRMIVLLLEYSTTRNQGYLRIRERTAMTLPCLYTLQRPLYVTETDLPFRTHDVSSQAEPTITSYGQDGGGQGESHA